MSLTKAQIAERDKARQELRAWLKPGDTLYTKLQHVARSGMMRVVQPVIIRPSNDPKYPEPVILYPTYLVAQACGMTVDRKHEGIRVGGCGMDVGFEVAYNLGHALWPDGVPCAGETCQSNDHRNRGVEADQRGPGVVHKDGGYALRHSWL